MPARRWDKMAREAAERALAREQYSARAGDCVARLWQIFGHFAPLARALRLGNPLWRLGLGGRGPREGARIGGSRIGLARLPSAPRWPAAVLALVPELACAAAGGNSSFLAALAWIGVLLVSALLFVRVPMPLRVWQQLGGHAGGHAGTVAAALGALLVWVGLPLMTQALEWTWTWTWAVPAMAVDKPAWPMVFLKRVLTPPLAPDLLPLGVLGAASGVALFFAAALVGMGDGNLRRLAEWITGFAGLLFCGTLALRLLGLPDGWSLVIEDQRLHRFAGTLGNPNAAGVAYAMFSLIATGVAISSLAAWREMPGDGRLLGTLAALLVALAGLALVGITQSRSALVLLLVGHAVLLAGLWAGLRRPARGRPSVFSRLASVLVSGALLAGILALVGSATIDRFAPVGDDGISRLAIWQDYGAMVLHMPFAGYGLGAFAELNQRSLTVQTALDLWRLGAAHTAPLQWALEAGWPGLGLLVLATSLIFWRMLRCFRWGADPIGTAMLLAICTALLASMVDIALNVPAICVLTVVLAGASWGRALRGEQMRAG